MNAACQLLAVLIVGGAGCRSVPTDQVREAATPRPPPITGTATEDTDLPGIGEAPDVIPSSRPIEVSDPLERVNRACFRFNDKLYFWILEPAARCYGHLLTPPARCGVRNFFAHIATPVRLVSCVLQADFMGAWVETERFVINTTVGVAGFGDPARSRWNLETRDEDLGQTLGRYGIGPSIYINWPILGPSCLRDSVGYVGDLFLDPVSYVVPGIVRNVGVRVYDTVNDTSLRLGEYEDFTEAAIDPYLALRDAYYQYRRHLVNNDSDEEGIPP